MRSFFIKSSRIKVEGQHQLTSTTKEDRYPNIFKFVKELLIEEKINIKILSYGCSTGQECQSIRKYMPNAAIVGADINLTNLKKARKKNRDNNIHFIESNMDNLKSHGLYNVIFAMSVLCRWEDTKGLENCSEIYHFDKFETSIRELTELLIPGGFLVLYNSNFRLEDSSVFENFIPLDSNMIQDSGFVHKFDKNNNRVKSEHKAVVYKKGN